MTEDAFDFFLAEGFWITKDVEQGPFLVVAGDEVPMLGYRQGEAKLEFLLADVTARRAREPVGHIAGREIAIGLIAIIQETLENRGAAEGEDGFFVGAVEDIIDVLWVTPS